MALCHNRHHQLSFSQGVQYPLGLGSRAAGYRQAPCLSGGGDQCVIGAAAVKAVCADEIIARLPEGYDTQVGEGGSSLSTGEKQLLSFARALLADPRIFVLDEATSSVDTITEQKLQQAIETVMRGRTSFIVAHRLSTIRRADVILVVQDGRIIEQGSHRALMEQKGAYYALYTRQYREQAMQAFWRGGEPA